MKNHLPIIIASVVFSMAIFSCRKDDPVPPEKYTPLFLPQAIKDYMYFKPGTWWVYEEETTEQLDSVYVYYAAGGLDSVYEEGRLTAVYEWFNVYTTSALDGYTYRYWTNTSWTNTNDNTTPVFRSKYKAGDFDGQTIIFYYQPVIGMEMATLNYLQSTVVPTDKYDSLNVLGIYYYQVYNFYEKKNITESNQSTIFSFGMNTGIIKKQLLDSAEVWHLIRSDLLQ